MFSDICPRGTILTMITLTPGKQNGNDSKFLKMAKNINKNKNRHQAGNSKYRQMCQTEKFY